jgi:starvation-inducible DNA-binding protein
MILQKELEKCPIGLTDEAAEEAVKALLSLLSMSYLLAVKTQNYHWNVTGAHFHPLHALFEEQYNELTPAVDEVAERVRQLGYFVPGTTQFYQHNAVTEEQNDFPDATEMLRRLLADNMAIANQLRRVVPELEKIGVDQVSCDMLSDRVAVHEKNAWMLRSHLAH